LFSRGTFLVIGVIVLGIGISAAEAWRGDEFDHAFGNADAPGLRPG
jgi:hypothetical protein